MYMYIVYVYCTYIYIQIYIYCTYILCILYICIMYIMYMYVYYYYSLFLYNDSFCSIFHIISNTLDFPNFYLLRQSKWFLLPIWITALIWSGIEAIIFEQVSQIEESRCHSRITGCINSFLLEISNSKNLRLMIPTACRWD